ncbi:MAG TPA: hypothetical protein VL307_13475 [Chitinophagaceae bacterium]|nr:hypothetical protein [Chitinophagaceae bacterium]
MTARTFISLMLILTVFFSAFVVFASPARLKAEKNNCPTSIDSGADLQLQAGDGMIFQSVSRHLLTVVQ